jgi:2-polyprenyl-3-methyl-5-hydroxy-6-metoxy-1,4-benzoquinol methylase
VVEVFGAPLYRCAACRLIFPYPFPSREEMVRRHQSEEYAAHPYFSAGEALADGDGLAFHQCLLAALLQHLPGGGRLLDIGAGTGDFLRLAATRFDVAGVEPSSHLAQRIRERLSCPLHVGPFETYQPDTPFDVVTMMDIIEHAADPRALVRHAFEVLKPGGLLFVCTVDSRALLYGLSPIIWRLSAASSMLGYLLRRIYCYQHNWYFNRDVLRATVETAGFRVLDHQGYEFPLDRLRENAVVIAGLRAIYAIQHLLGANTEQYLLAARH